MFERPIVVGNLSQEVLIEPDNLGGGEVLGVQDGGTSHDQAKTRETRVAQNAQSGGVMADPKGRS
jgi:hypothetical protein